MARILRTFLCISMKRRPISTFSLSRHIHGRAGARASVKIWETSEDFSSRLDAWEKSSDGVRTVGRSSSDYWSRVWCRRDARKAYHAAVEHLGLGYGRDFVEEGQPSPEHKLTGTWVRETAADIARNSAILFANLDAVQAERADLLISVRSLLVKSRSWHLSDQRSGQIVMS